MGELDFRSNAVSEANRTVIERPVTAQDIENIDSLDLDNFSCDFSKIEVPKGDIDDEAMDALVNDFFDVMAA